jgi:predicted component of type VI protein secretion system
MAGKIGFWKLLTGDTRFRPFEDVEETLRQDVLRNLSNVLNARRGRIFAHEDYGLDDIEDLGSSPLRVAECIRRLVLQYEPRIDVEGLRVIPTKSEGRTKIFDGYFRQSFVVEGRMIMPKGKSRPIHIRTTVVSEAAQIEGQVESLDEPTNTNLHPRRVFVEEEVSS